MERWERWENSGWKEMVTLDKLCGGWSFWSISPPPQPHSTPKRNEGMKKVLDSVRVFDSPFALALPTKGLWKFSCVCSVGAQVSNVNVQVQVRPSTCRDQLRLVWRLILILGVLEREVQIDAIYSPHRMSIRLGPHRRGLSPHISWHELSRVLDDYLSALW